MARFSRSRRTTDFLARRTSTGVLVSAMYAAYIVFASSRGDGRTGESTWLHGAERSDVQARMPQETAITNAPTATCAAILPRATAM